MACQQSANQLRIANVSLRKDMPRLPFEALQIIQVARVGELVQIHNCPGRKPKPVQNKIRPDESRSTGYKNCVSQFQFFLWERAAQSCVFSSSKLLLNRFIAIVPFRS